MAKKVKAEILSDNEGVSIGSVGSYVSAFKKDKEITKITQKTSSSAKANRKVLRKPSNPNVLPEKYTEENEKTIFVYYYCKFGNLDCDDFDTVKGKIASAVNRLYNKTLLPDDALKKLDVHVSPADIDIDDYEEETGPSEETSKTDKRESIIKVDLLEGDYFFVKDLEPLNGKELDLCRFVEKGSLCFSSDGYKFYLAKHPKNKDCFDKLFEFSPKEEMVYMMFKEQLGDEHKAKKLVLMSRILNEPDVPKVETKVKTTKTKTPRKKKANHGNKTTELKSTSGEA